MKITSKLFSLSRAWYQKTGIVQFLLGNEWNDFDGKAAGGHRTLGFCWLMIIISAAQTVMLLCCVGG